MRKYFLLAGLSAFIITAVYISSCKGKDKETAAAGSDDSLKKMVDRGYYLSHYVSQCLDCHSVRDTGRFSMPVVPGTEGGGSAFPFGPEEGVPGYITPPNITPDSATGIGSWTDEELVRAITRGINKKGDTLFPLMGYHHFAKMTKYDIMSIVAYIRTLKPIQNDVPERKLNIPMSMLGPLPDGNLDNNVMPDSADKVKYGEYMVNAALCSECHTPMTERGPDMSKVFAGGFIFNLPFMKVAVANITPDSATGIGTWTEEMFVNKFKQNSSDAVVNSRPGRENTIMPWAMYGKMTDTDLKAIYAYLRTVKPISNKVEKYPK